MRVLKRLFGEEFNNLLVLNLITAALFVPIITIGPAILALKGTLIKAMDGRCALSRVQEYKSLFKKKFWRGVLLEVLFALYALVILWCKTLSDQIGQAGRPLLYVAVLAGALAALVSVCTASILSCVQMPFTQALWNGVCLALGRLPRAVGSAVCVFGLTYAAVMFYPYSLLFCVVILLSTASVLSLAFLWDPLEDLVLDRCDDPESDATEE